MANFENNFWKEYPGLEYQEEFNKLYEGDTSKDKQKSSKIMWAIYLCVHPESNLYNDPNKEDTIIRTFIKDDTFKWSDYEDLIYAYKDVSLTTAEKALQNWNELMIMRDKSLKKLYTETMQEQDIPNLEKLDKILSNTPKMFNDYAKIKKDYEEEKTQLKGKSVKSLSDADDI